MSSFKAKQRDTHATRRKTAQRHAVTGDEIDGPMLRRVPNALPDELVSAATGGSTTGEIGGGGGGSEPWPASVAPHHGLSLPPARPQEIYVVPSGADKRQVLREMLARLRAAEKSARQKTRVLVLVSTPATARALEAYVKPAHQHLPPPLAHSLAPTLPLRNRCAYYTHHLLRVAVYPLVVSR
jgi:hypothetical protein|eukprot:COSAG01_NODE_6037_length_3886_cov_1.914972_1_plen_183_part_00